MDNGLEKYLMLIKIYKSTFIMILNDILYKDFNILSYYFLKKNIIL